MDVRVLLEVAWVLDHAGWWLVQLVLIGLIEVNIWLGFEVVFINFEN